jgi:class 3 adenylate cyclase
VAPTTVSAAIKCKDVVLGTIEMRSHAPMDGSPESKRGEERERSREGFFSSRFSSRETKFLEVMASKLSEYLTRAAQTDTLLERQKVLACLHRTTQYSIGNGEHGMRQFLSSIMTQIQESMQFPTMCDIEIRLFCSGGDKEIVVSTPLFNDKKWTLQTNIALPGTNAHNPVITVDYEDDGVEIVPSKLKKNASMMSSIDAATELCVAIENFAAAKELKDIKNKMTAVECELATMEIEKQDAIMLEDYDTASVLRDRIEHLRNCSLSSSLMIVVESIGTVIVSYRHPKLHEKSPVDMENPWLEEERSLLQSICSQLALMVHSRGSDMLLSSMLPKNIAQTLRENGSIQPTKHTCTILFTDIVGFTQMSSESAPEAIFNMLNALYTRLDLLVEDRGDKLYKVETIGDAYMVVSGLPMEMEHESHSTEIAQLALRLIEAVRTVSITMLDGTTKPIHIRCGIHSGDVVAGVVGLVNPRYCLFGDSVNIASRMESSSEKMRVHCSKTTFECLRREEERENGMNAGWELVPRGGIEIKGKGNMETWWIEKRVTEIVQNHRRRSTGSVIEQNTTEIMHYNRRLSKSFSFE